jgi:hypothetical protein
MVITCAPILMNKAQSSSASRFTAGAFGFRVELSIKLRTNSGGLAMFAKILRASSLLSNLAAERRPGSFSK